MQSPSAIESEGVRRVRELIGKYCPEFPRGLDLHIPEAGAYLDHHLENDWRDSYPGWLFPDCTENLRLTSRSTTIYSLELDGDRLMTVRCYPLGTRYEDRVGPQGSYRIEEPLVLMNADDILDSSEKLRPVHNPIEAVGMVREFCRYLRATK